MKKRRCLRTTTDAREDCAPDVIARSLAYLPKYGALNTEKLDTGALDAAQTAREIARLAGIMLPS